VGRGQIPSGLVHEGIVGHAAAVVVEAVARLGPRPVRHAAKSEAAILRIGLAHEGASAPIERPDLTIRIARGAFDARVFSVDATVAVVVFTVAALGGGLGGTTSPSLSRSSSQASTEFVFAGTGHGQLARPGGARSTRGLAVSIDGAGVALGAVREGAAGLAKPGGTAAIDTGWMAGRVGVAGQTGDEPVLDAHRKVAPTRVRRAPGTIGTARFGTLHGAAPVAAVPGGDAQAALAVPVPLADLPDLLRTTDLGPVRASAIHAVETRRAICALDAGAVAPGDAIPSSQGVCATAASRQAPPRAQEDENHPPDPAHGAHPRKPGPPCPARNGDTPVSYGCVKSFRRRPEGPRGGYEPAGSSFQGVEVSE